VIENTGIELWKPKVVKIANIARKTIIYYYYIILICIIQSADAILKVHNSKITSYACGIYVESRSSSFPRCDGICPYTIKIVIGKYNAMLSSIEAISLICFR